MQNERKLRREKRIKNFKNFLVILGGAIGFGAILYVVCLMIYVVCPL